MHKVTRIALVAAALVAGCNRPEIVTALDHPFHLGVGRQAVIPTKRVEIGFKRVVSDSRCPEGATCVWAGEAQVEMWLGHESGDRQAFEAKLTAKASADSATVVDVGEYRIHVLGLTPYPKAGQATDSTAYALELKVTER